MGTRHGKAVNAKSIGRGEKDATKQTNFWHVPFATSWSQGRDFSSPMLGYLWVDRLYVYVYMYLNYMYIHTYQLHRHIYIYLWHT